MIPVIIILTMNLLLCLIILYRWMKEKGSLRSLIFQKFPCCESEETDSDSDSNEPEDPTTKWKNTSQTLFFQQFMNGLPWVMQKWDFKQKIREIFQILELFTYITIGTNPFHYIFNVLIGFQGIIHVLPMIWGEIGSRFNKKETPKVLRLINFNRIDKFSSKFSINLQLFRLKLLAQNKKKMILYLAKRTK